MSRNRHPYYFRWMSVLPVAPLGPDQLPPIIFQHPYRIAYFFRHCLVVRSAYSILQLQKPFQQGARSLLAHGRSISWTSTFGNGLCRTG